MQANRIMAVKSLQLRLNEHDAFGHRATLVTLDKERIADMRSAT